MQVKVEGLHTVPGAHRVAAFGRPGTKEGEGREVGVTASTVGVGDVEAEKERLAVGVKVGVRMAHRDPKNTEPGAHAGAV